MDNNKEQYKRFLAESTHLIDAIRQETEKEKPSEWYIKEKCSQLKIQIVCLQACFEK